MYQAKLESFLSDLLNTDSLGGYFWNLMDLAKGNMEHYSGPRDESDYYRIMAGNNSDEYKRHSKVLLDFYENIDSDYTKKCLTYFFWVAPLVAEPYQFQSIFSGTNYREIDCYTCIVADINMFSNSKLKYDLLTRIMNRIENKYGLNKKYRTVVPMQEMDEQVYEVARFFRANCKYAKQDNPQIRETLLQDLHGFMRFANPSNVKLDYAKRLRQVLLQKLQHTIKTNNTDQAIHDVCAQAYQYIAGAGAANQKFVERAWDEFDYPAIIGVPSVAQKILDSKTK